MRRRCAGGPGGPCAGRRARRRAGRAAPGEAGGVAGQGQRRAPGAGCAAHGRDQAAQIGGQVAVIAAEQFVAALPAVDHDHPGGAGELADEILREGARPGHRLVQVPDQAGQHGGQVVARWARSRGGRCGSAPATACDIGPLVVVRALVERAGEGLHRPRQLAADQAPRWRAIHPAAEVRAQRHIAAQAQAHAVFEQRAHFVDIVRLAARPGRVFVVGQVPVARDLQPVRSDQSDTGRAAAGGCPGTRYGRRSVCMARKYSAMAAPLGCTRIAGWRSSALISEAKAKRRPSHQ